MLTEIMTESTKAKLKFMIYVRTKQMLNSKYKGNKKGEAVHISQKVIETKFFIYPDYNRKECLNELVEEGHLKINKGKFFTYEALTSGAIDLSLVKPKIDNFNNEMISSIRSDLKHVTLTENAPSTEYFDLFLKHKDNHINHFFTVDNFSRRLHTPITNFHRDYRSNILFYGSEIASLDVATMQPLLLGKILKKEIGFNEFSEWINSGKDIYIMLQEKANLETRDEAKRRFFEILFAPASDSLKEMFGSSNWIDWINNYKKQVVKGNPHNKEKRHSNLAWLLQRTEVEIMYKVWMELYNEEIPFLTIHDEIITRIEDSAKAERLFSQVLSNSFEYYKLNSKVNQEKIYEFKINSVQSEIILEEIIKNLITEKADAIIKSLTQDKKVVDKKEKVKAVKREKSNIARDIFYYLTNQDNLEKEIKNFYRQNYKTDISENNLIKTIEFYHTKTIMFTMKSYGRFLFNINFLI
jgi:hypothetical protein